MARPVQRVSARRIDPPAGDRGQRSHSRRARAGARSTVAAPNRAAPFDLSRAPLLRAQLLRLDKTEHVLQLVVHHIVSDGWSMGMMARELSALYAAFVAGEPAPLAPLPIQFADYALWQRDRLRGTKARSASELLARAATRARATGVAHRSPASGGVGLAGSVSAIRPFAAELVARPQGARAARERHAVHGAAGGLQGAADALLRPARCGGGFAGGRTQSHRARGADRLLRQHAGAAQRSVGQPHLRASCSPGCGRSALDAYAHQELPFDRLVAELSPQRDLEPQSAVSGVVHSAEPTRQHTTA